MQYRRHFPTRNVPQTEPIPGSAQVQNYAGGYVYEMDEWDRLARFLILGVDGPTYYTSERELIRSNAQHVLSLIQSDGLRVVQEVVAISESGRAPKNDPAIFVLALCCTQGDEATRSAGYSAVARVCRTGTHLFQFYANYAELDKNGRGRKKAGSQGMKRAIANWYSRDDLELQVIKYRERNGVSHSDLIYLMRPKLNAKSSLLVRWLLERRQHGNAQSHYAEYSELPLGEFRLIEGFERVQALPSLNLSDNQKALQAAELIRKYELPREALPTELLNSREVWEALLEKMPMTAMIRNLAVMTRVGLLEPFSDSVKQVSERLGNAEVLRRARVHPISLLLALKTYATGRGFRGSGTWTPIPQVVDALNTSFYLAFKNVEPTGKNWYLGVDVSGSMSSGGIAGTNLTPGEGAAALSLVTANTESNYVIKGFQDRLVDLGISPNQRLDDVVRRTSGLSFGATDCAQPMIDALNNKYPIDVFVVITDNETWAGRGGHPTQALDAYQQKMGRPAKLIVIGMTSTGFSIADPKRKDNLDVVGFDSAVPEIMRNFVLDS